MRIPGGLIRSGPSFKVLMRNRRDAFTHPGGDTVLMERLRDGLQGLGHAVQIDLEADADVAAFDIVHLFNLTLPGLIGPSAEAAREKGIPLVIQALQEDWPRFLNQSMAAAVVLQKYVEAGQPPGRLDPALALLRECPAAEMPVCRLAEGASAILCTGAEESATVLRDYPAARIRVIPLATAAPEASISGYEAADFRREFGVDDFVLCVGRLESRKNQLMLLAALEASDLTLVFADGGFAYGSGYAEACRNFKRRGRTVFTGRLSPAMLRSAYRSARVSCLPSWYELPGLAALEAAFWSRQVVTTPCGTIREYLGETCLYAEPADYSALGDRVREAWNAEPNPDLSARAGGFTWERCVRETETLYRELTASRN